MTTTYRHTATGTVYRPGAVVGGVQTHARMSDEAWAALGCEPYTPPKPPAPTLDELLAAALARVRAATQAHILAVYPDWYQLDVAMGIYPEAACQACRDGIAACIEACNRVEDLIAVAANADEIAAAESVLALPEITR